jgi:uncharacterized protein (TIGR03435 family)
MSKLSLLLALAAGLAFAAEPQFEVATIRPSVGGPGGWVPGIRNGRFSTTAFPFKALIGYAYSIPEIQISGPDWLTAESFDITATLPAGAEPDQAPLMLRALLEERFHIKTHREMIEMNYYALTIGKNGTKLKPLVPGEPIPTPKFGPDRPPSTLMTNGTMGDFAAFLAKTMGRPVVDKTELTGRFHILLQYTPPSSTLPGPDILTAIQEELGLKLESQKGPVEILKVDSADKVPTEN